MDVRVLVHIELVGARPCWWAESPDMAGFSASASSLAELTELCEEAARSSSDDQRLPAPTIRWQLVGETVDAPRAANELHREAETEGDLDVHVVAIPVPA